MLGRFPLGTMQGRLVPKLDGRYQAHPKGYWRDEFKVAAELGLDLIEFILDYDDAEANPLLCNPETIKRAVSETGVSVKSICADYFIEVPLQRDSSCLSVLDRLLDNAALLGIRDIVIPCVDQSSLAGEADTSAFIAAIRPLVAKAEQSSLNLSLETDLAPRPFAALLEKLNSRAVTVNYDTGNSAALGYDPREEFAAYGTRITDIHIKDRTVGGGPVVLGEGDCAFDIVFPLIAQSSYVGPLIMQAYRDDEGLAIFKRQKAWLEERFGAKLE